MYKIILLPEAKHTLVKLKGEPLQRVAEKITWLKQKADLIIHHPLTSLPDELKGLCRIRVGDYRIIYWIYNETRTIKIYGIEHRSKAYKLLHK